MNKLKRRDGGRLESKVARILILVAMGDGRVWSVDDLRRRIEDEYALTDEDRKPYLDRPNEEIWYATVDNVLSESRNSSLCGKGLTRKIGHGAYQITEKGKVESGKYKKQLSEKRKFS